MKQFRSFAKDPQNPDSRVEVIPFHGGPLNRKLRAIDPTANTVEFTRDEGNGLARTWRYERDTASTVAAFRLRSTRTGDGRILIPGENPLKESFEVS